MNKEIPSFALAVSRAWHTLVKTEYDLRVPPGMETEAWIIEHRAHIRNEVAKMLIESLEKEVLEETRKNHFNLI